MLRNVSEGCAMGDRYECARVGKESVYKIALPAQPVLSFGNCGACRAKLVPNRRPQLLPCLHSLCLQCVPQARGVSEGECPVCGEAFSPKNVICDPFHTDSLCSPAKPASKCGGCGSSEVGGWCMECVDQLCAACISAHQRVKVTRTHSVLLLHDPRMAPPPMLHCSMHKNEIARLFCESCDKPICSTCGETLHWSHRVSTLELVPGNERAAIQPLLEDLEQQRNVVKLSLSDLDRRLLDLNEMQAKLKGDIHNMILHIRDALMKHAMSLSLRVQDLCDMERRRVLERKEALWKLNERQSYLLSFGKRALDPDGSWALSSCRKKLREQLVHILCNDVSPGRTMLTALLCFDGDVCSEIEAIGKLVVRDVPFACTNHQISVDTPLPRHSHKIQSPNSQVVPSTQTASTSSPNILALRSSCQISQNCPNVTLIPPTPSQVPPTSLQIQPTSCQIPPTSSQIPPPSCQIPPTSRQIQFNTAQIPPNSFWIPTTSCQIPPTSLQIRPNAAQIPPSSSLIPTTSCLIQPNAVQNPPISSCRIPPTLQIQSNATQTPRTSSLIPTTSCQIPPTSLQIQPNAAQIPPSSSLIPTTSCQIQPNAVQIPLASCQIPPTSSKIQPSAAQIPPTFLQIPTTSCQIPPTFVQIRPEAALIPPSSSRILTTSCQIPPTSLQIQPNAAQIPPSSSLIPTTSCQIQPNAVQIPPASCQIPPTSSKIQPSAAQIPPTFFQIPATSCQIPPTFVQIRPKAALIPPSSSRIPTTSCQIPPTLLLIPPKSAQIPPTSSKNPSTSGQIPPTFLQSLPNAAQIPPTSSQIPTTSCQTPPTSLKTLPNAAQTPHSSCQIQPTLCLIPSAYSHVYLSSSMIPPTSSVIPQSSSDTHPSSTLIPSNSSLVSPTSLPIPPISCQIAPNSVQKLPKLCQISLTSRQTPPTSDQIPPTSLQIHPNSAQIPPISSQSCSPSSQISPASSQIHSNSRNGSSKLLHTLLESCGIYPDSCRICPSSHPVHPGTHETHCNSSQTPPTSSQTPPVSSKAPSVSSQIPPTSRHIPFNSSHAPTTGNPPTSPQIPPTCPDFVPSSEKTPTCIVGECPADVPAYQSKHSRHPVVVTQRFPSGPHQPHCCPAAPSTSVPLSAPFPSDAPTSNSQMPNSNTPVSSLGSTGSDPPISVRSSDLIGSKLQTPPEVELQVESDLIFHPGKEDGSDCTQDTGNEGVPDPRITDRRLLVPRVSLVQLPVSFPPPGHPLPQFLLKPEVFSAGSEEFLLEQIPEDHQFPQLPSSNFKPVILRVPLPSPPPKPPTQPTRGRKVRCAMCHESGVLKMCATCGRSFHEDCHLIPIGTNDSDRWRCIVCEDRLEVIVHQSTVSEDGGALSLPDQKKCKRLFLTLIGKPYSTILYQQPEFVSDSVRYVDITLIRDRLLLKLSPPYLPSEFVSDVWLLLWSLPKSPKDNTRLEMLQKTFQKALRSTFGSSLHPSLLGLPPGKEGEVAKGDAISEGTKDRKKRKRKREEEAGPLKKLAKTEGLIDCTG